MLRAQHKKGPSPPRIEVLLVGLSRDSKAARHFEQGLRESSANVDADVLRGRSHMTRCTGLRGLLDAETIGISSRDLRRNPDDPLLRKLRAEARDLLNRCYTEAG